MTANPLHRSVFNAAPKAPSGTGLRVAIKDSIDMAGVATTCGSPALAHRAAAGEDAMVVRRLRAAGCDIVGRTTMHELAYGVTGINAWTGTPINPFYPELIPGGSSSGSAAAVAAGLVDFALGTDTGGSVRVPATCCGIVGFKPSFGRVSREGVTYEGTSLDCVGPFARDVAGIEQAMAIMAPDWSNAGEVNDGRVAFIETDCDGTIDKIVRGAAGQTFTVVEGALPDFAAAMGAGLAIIAHETWQAVGYLAQSNLLGLDVHQRLLDASRVTEEAIKEAEETRRRFTIAVDSLLEDCDALAMPAMPCAVPSLHEAADASTAIPITSNARPFNLSGHPAIVLPVGESGDRPVSIQLVGRKGEDEALCALARRINIYHKGEE